MDHYDLIKRAQDGDAEAFEALFRTCYAPVYRFVLSRLKSPDDADDVTQDVFIKFLAALPRYEQQRHSALPYLFAIARNAIVDRYRTRRPELSVDELWERESEDPSPEEVAMLGEEAAHAVTLVNSLKETDAMVIRLKYFDGFSTAEIAETLDKSEEAIRQIMSRSMAHLRSLYTGLRSD